MNRGLDGLAQTRTLFQPCLVSREIVTLAFTINRGISWDRSAEKSHLNANGLARAPHFLIPRVSCYADGRLGVSNIRRDHNHENSFQNFPTVTGFSQQWIIPEEILDKGEIVCWQRYEGNDISSKTVAPAH